MRRNIPVHYRTSPDHRSFTDFHIRQDDTVRPDEHILLNDNFSISNRSSWAGIKVRDDRCPKSDDAVIANADVCGMDFIDVDKLANPDIFPDRHAAHPLQPWSHTKTPRRDKGNLARKPTEQNWQSQRFSTPHLAEAVLRSRVATNLNLSYSIHCSVFPLRRTLTGAQLNISDFFSEMSPSQLL